MYTHYFKNNYKATMCAIQQVRKQNLPFPLKPLLCASCSTPLAPPEKEVLSWWELFPPHGTEKLCFLFGNNQL